MVSYFSTEPNQARIRLAREEAREWLSRLSHKQTVSFEHFVPALSSLLAHLEEVPTISASPATGVRFETNLLALLEQNLSEALAQDDEQALRQLISKCLGIVQTEKAHRSSTLSARAPAALPALDSATGLPGRLWFEQAVMGSLTEGQDSLLALFVVERLPLINKRFGRAAGDRAVLHFAQYLAKELPDPNALSRWDGPAFCVIVHAEESGELETVARAILNKPLSTNIDVGNRSVMLTITCTCLMERADASTSPEELFGKMDNFVAKHTGV